MENLKVEVSEGDYNFISRINCIESNNRFKLRFSYLPSFSLEESVSYFRKSLMSYLDDFFFCEKEKEVYLKYPEMEEAERLAKENNISKYYLVVKEK